MTDKEKIAAIMKLSNDILNMMGAVAVIISMRELYLQLEKE